MQVLAHNMLSQFSNRQLKITSRSKAKTAEKLATGYRINRSADDAAGLSISEKMRWQVRGLNKASDNMQDGISLIQVADGALEETHAILQRMRELSVQAANDTNTETDRNAIQREMDALTREVDRIAEDTSFNGEIYPLSTVSLVSNSRMKVSPSGATWIIPDDFQDYSFTAETISATTNTIDGVVYGPKTMVSANAIMFTGGNGKGWWQPNGCAILSNGSITYKATKEMTSFGSSSWDSLSISDLKVTDNGNIWYEDVGGASFFCSSSLTAIEFSGRENSNCIKALAINDKSGLWIQMGAKAEQGMFINLVDATASGIGIKDPPLTMADYQKAGEAIVRLDDAIAKVSEYRSNFGAQQNRLDHAQLVVDNTSENTQAAESRIRDTNMAKEMVELAKYNILEQAGQAMLAQANTSQQGILTLLQS